MGAFGPAGTIDRMRRRSRRAAALAAALVLAAGIAACGGDEPAAAPVGRTGLGAASPSAPPTAAAPAPATTRGTAPTRAYGVDTRSLDLNRGGDRPLEVTVYHPDASAGRFPVVLFSHGLGGLPSDYAPLLRRWAAAGFVVAAPAYPHTSRTAPDRQAFDVVNQPADASYVLDQVLALDTRRGDPLRGRLATDRVAAAGHSAGGITTVGLFTAARDERLDAGVVLAGNSLGVGTAFSGSAAPQLFVHGERDDVVSYASGKAAFDAVPWPKALLSLPDGDHGGSLLAAGAPAFAVVVDTTTEFLRWTLYGDAAAKRRLPAEASAGGVAVLDDRL
jgi:dienelactone hydrolase